MHYNRPLAETSNQNSSTMCHEMKNDRQDCGMVFCCRVALLCIHVLPEAHNTLPYPATAQHRPLGNDSPIFACLLDFRGVEPLNRRVRSSVQMIPHEEFDGSAKDSFFIFVPLYLPYSFILCTLLVSKQCCHC